MCIFVASNKYIFIMVNVTSLKSAPYGKESFLMNRNFRVKVGRLLVGWSGLVKRIGFDRACLFLAKALRGKNDVKRFKVSSLNVVVSFYVK